MINYLFNTHEYMLMQYNLMGTNTLKNNYSVKIVDGPRIFNGMLIMLTNKTFFNNN